MPESIAAASLLSPLGFQSGSCGYCKNEETSQRTPDSRAAYYAKTKSLSPEHYQMLMDRGWRRSGTLLYLPDAARSCCPHYTIRLPAAEFKASRDQRQALNRWNRFVLGDEYIARFKQKYPLSREEKKRSQVSFDLGAALHESEVKNVKSELDPAHRFEVSLENDDFTKEKFALFNDYQQHVHHETPDEITQSGFKHFLCSSPLQVREDDQRLGSVHQCYRLDGRLIAMAVLDLLPHAVSAVYFIYHHDFEKWSLGKLSALREVTLTLEGGYQFYYMGYYIHGCPKMRYKGHFKPQYVLDYYGFEWNPLNDEMTTLMEKRKYASMSLEKQHQAAPGATEGSDGSNENASGYYHEDIKFPDPLEAMQSHLSVLELGMPGITPLDQLKREMDLDHIKIYLDKVVCAHWITTWETGSETDPHSIRGIITEFAAALGPKLAKEIIVDFSR